MKVLAVSFQTVVLLSLCLATNAQSPPQRSTQIGVGAMAPDFTLEDQNKNKVTLTDMRQKSPVVLVFYRGYW